MTLAKTQNVDSRSDIKSAMNELNNRKQVINDFMDDTMPEQVIEVLNTEIEDVDNSISSLQFVLDEYYQASCQFCQKMHETEYPGSIAICATCDIDMTQSLGR